MGALVIFIAAAAIWDFLRTSPISLLEGTDPLRTQGTQSAKWKVVAFTDFLGPDSARGQAVFKEFLLRNPTDIFWTVKYYSIGHIHSTPAFLYAQCSANQSRFFDYQDVLLTMQPQWSNAAEVENYLRLYAQKLGLDLRKLKACVEDDNTKAVIFRETAQGAEHLVKTVPTYFINGEMLEGSKALSDYLAEHLAQ